MSANAGWNLLIGAGSGATGAWVPVERAGLPPDCRHVFDEAEKDACFGRAALRQIRAQPARWLALVPAKLGYTFDASGSAGHYLRASNPTAFPLRMQHRLAAAETVYQRLLLALALLAGAAWPGPRRRMRIGAAVLSGLALLQVSVWLSYLGLTATVAFLGRALWRQPPALLAAGAVAITAIIHVVFFGAGRYSLVCYPLLAALAGSALRRAAQ